MHDGIARVGCPECGDEYWDRAPGSKCDCGARLIVFSENDYGEIMDNATAGWDEDGWLSDD